MKNKKKVLVIPSWYPSKEEPHKGTFFKEQAELMQEEFEMKIFIGQHHRYSFLKSLWITLVFILFKKVLIQKTQGIFLDSLPIYEFRYGLPLFRINQYRNACYQTFFNQHISLWQPELIHAHDALFGGIIAEHISTKNNIPYIITEHNYFYANRSHSIQKKLKSCMSNAKKILFVSDFQRKVISLWSIPFEKTVIVGNYVDDEKFNINISDKEYFSILYVGRNDYYKDIITFFETMKFIFKYNTFKVYIVGVSENEVKKHIQDEKILSNMYIYNFLEREKIRLIYEKANVLVSTSVLETFGVAVCEALMCGIPVIATKSGGVEDIITSENGILCEIKNVNEIAEKITKIYTGELIFDSMKIRNSVLHKYGKTSFKEKISKIYSECLYVI